MNQKKSLFAIMVIMQGILCNSVFAENFPSISPYLNPTPPKLDPAQLGSLNNTNLDVFEEAFSDDGADLKGDLESLAEKIRNDLTTAKIEFKNVYVTDNNIIIEYKNGDRSVIDRLKTSIYDSGGALINSMDYGWHAYVNPLIFEYLFSGGILAYWLAPATTLKYKTIIAQRANMIRAFLSAHRTGLLRLAIPLAAGGMAGDISQRYFSGREIDFAQKLIKKYIEEKVDLSKKLANLEKQAKKDGIDENVERKKDDIKRKLATNKKNIDWAQKYIKEREADNFFDNVTTDVNNIIFGPDTNREIYNWEGEKAATSSDPVINDLLQQLHQLQDDLRAQQGKLWREEWAQMNERMRGVSEFDLLPQNMKNQIILSGMTYPDTRTTRTKPRAPRYTPPSVPPYIPAHHLPSLLR